MGEAERVNLERQIRDGQREFERTRNELVEDFNLRQNEELGQIQRDVIARTRAYASEQKFDLLLFGDQSVVFASTAVDVTAAVLAALQASPAPAAAPARGQ
jgi:outer membrane protein